MEKMIIHPEFVCSREITVEHEDGIIKSVNFVGGCQGNTTAVSKLLVGRKISDIIPLLKGIRCRGSRTGQTSCPDQLAIGIEKQL